jgi:aminoglycoside phosphotransferase (APT) family kinase protein
LVEMLAPGSTTYEVHPLPGSFSNATHVVEARDASGERMRLVIRRYVPFGGYDRGEKARREYETLAFLAESGVPAPRPLYLDVEGALLGCPGIVTGYVSGELVLSPADPIPWARAMASMLARIHALTCHASVRRFLLDANAEAAWFLRDGTVPDYVAAYPDGAAVWRAVRDLLPRARSVAPALVHIDYWSGNVLWDGDRIAAVVDWEEAAYGDPGIDVAYCRMDMVLAGRERAAQAFLEAYEAGAGRRVADLGLWELAAAVRPMFDPDGWLADPGVRERLGQFIASALRRAGC